MTRRARGEGSLSKYVTSGGRTRWRAQWWEPVDPADPRRGRRQRSRGGFETRAAARDVLLAQLVGIERPIAAVPGRAGPKFVAYANTWLDGHRCEPTTRLYIQRAIDAVAPFIGDLPITEIRPTDLAAAYRALEAGRLPRHRAPASRPPLAASTVFRYSGWIVTIFNSAIDEGLLERNPASHKNAGRPRGPRARRPSRSRCGTASRRRSSAGGRWLPGSRGRTPGTSSPGRACAPASCWRSGGRTSICGPRH